MLSTSLWPSCHGTSGLLYRPERRWAAWKCLWCLNHSTTTSLTTAFRWNNKKRARWKLSLSSPMQPSLYHMLLVLLISSGLQEGDRSVPSAALCLGCTWSHPSRHSEMSGPRAMRRTHATPLPGVNREAVSLSRGILFVEKQVTVEEGLQERANRSPCAGLITALRRFCSSSVPARHWRGDGVSLAGAFLFRAFSRGCFLLLSLPRFFSYSPVSQKGPPLL